MICYFKNCDIKTIDNTTDYVQIRATLSKQCRQKLTSERNQFHINWTLSGDANLHKACWSVLLKHSRARSKKIAAKLKPPLEREEKHLIINASKTVEMHDSHQKLIASAKKAAKLLKESKHCVAFTGAGISTPAGIGDYRGRSGKWTEEERREDGLISSINSEQNLSTPTVPPSKRRRLCFDEVEDDPKSDSDTEEGVPYEDLRPTFSHEALQKLYKKSLLKHIISQNCDGLHSSSGIPDVSISSLHGDVFIEYCETCKKRYTRKYYVPDDESDQYYEEIDDFGKSSIKKPKHSKQCEQCGLSHYTGRQCEIKNCKGKLRDAIINFGDDLEESILEVAKLQAAKADIILCLGTTLMVTPACDLVCASDNNCLIICNRQKTAKDNELRPSDIRIYGDCDTFLNEVMKILHPEHNLKKWEAKRRRKVKKD